VKIAALESFMPFRGFSSKVTIGELFRSYDWAEPLPLTSPWLQRRRALLTNFHQHVASLERDLSDAGFLEFLFALVLHTTGSDALVDALEKDLSKVELDGLVCPGQMISKYIVDIGGRVFHTRFRPMIIWANGVGTAYKNVGLRLWSLIDHDEEMEEDECLDPLVGGVPAGSKRQKRAASPQPDGAGASGQNTNAIALAVKCLESMQSVSRLKEIWKRLQKNPEDIWEICESIRGFLGLGFNRKNFALLYFPVEQLQAASSGGTGAMFCYNISMGAPRKQHMSPATLRLLLNRDLIAAEGYWNGNFFGKKLFDLLSEEEQDLGAVAITSNRCEMDKLTWKIACHREPPQGYSTWRDYARRLRQHGS
jgi:hypothetical protein